MIEEVYSLCYILVVYGYSFVYYSFLYSYKIGEFLVILSDNLLRFCLISGNSLISVVLVLLESLNIFSQDVSKELQDFGNAIVNGVDVSSHCIINCVETLYNGVLSVVQLIVLVINTLCTVIAESVILCKELIILLGDGVWFLITLVPYLMFCACIHALYSMNNTVTFIYETGKSKIKDLYTFMTDIPYESLLGIIIAFSLLYIFMQFYKIIFLYLYQQTKTRCKTCYRCIKGAITHLYIARQNNTTDLRPRAITKRRPLTKQTLEDERFCIICQERSRCILILPCRHVCLCNECNIQLGLYSHTCPICRNNIDNTMMIFI